MKEYLRAETIYYEGINKKKLMETTEIKGKFILGQKKLQCLYILLHNTHFPQAF